MKIAVFIKSTTLHKNHGGYEVQNKILCEELVKRGSRVVVFSPKGDVQETECDLNGVKYNFIESDYKKYIFASLNPVSWYKKSLSAFSKINDIEKFDIVLSQSASGESIIRHKNEFNIKVISIAHGTAASEFATFVKNISNLKDVYWFIRNIQYFIRQYFGRQRMYVLHSNKVIAVSNYVKSALISETFVPENRVEVIHNGVDGSKYVFEKTGEKSKKVNFYFIGRVEKSKGILTILDILKDIKSDFTFHVVGNGPCLEDAKKKAIENNINDKVLFHGIMQHSDFIMKFKPDFLVFPTKRIEGFPMVLIESMYAGIPSVAFDCGGVSDAIENGKNGFLVKEGDKKLLKSFVEKLINDENLRLEMGKKSKEKAEREFSIGKMVDSYEKIIKEVLK